MDPTGAPLAHPLDDGTAVMLERSVDATAANLGEDGAAWRSLMEPFVAAWAELRHDLMAPLLGVPRHPLLMARFGLAALRSARALAESRFQECARGPCSPELRRIRFCRWRLRRAPLSA